MRIARLDHFVLTVSDAEATVEFYARVLGMKPVTFGGGRRALAFGDQKINLHELGSEHLPNARNAGSGTADVCFICDAPLDAVVEHLERAEVEIELGPAGADGAQGPLESVWLRDPDGNLIELSNRRR